MTQILIAVVFSAMLGLPVLNVLLFIAKPSLYRESYVTGIHADGTERQYAV